MQFPELPQDCNCTFHSSNIRCSYGRGSRPLAAVLRVHYLSEARSRTSFFHSIASVERILSHG